VFENRETGDGGIVTYSSSDCLSLDDGFFRPLGAVIVRMSDRPAVQPPKSSKLGYKGVRTEECRSAVVDNEGAQLLMYPPACPDVARVSLDPRHVRGSGASAGQRIPKDTKR